MSKSDKVPSLHDVFLIADDAYLTASLCSILSIKKKYLPIIDFPRLQRADHEAEVIRRNNSVARCQPKTIVIVSPTEDIIKSFQRHFPAKMVEYIYSVDDLKNSKATPKVWPKEILYWGKDNIGVGLLNALNQKKQIVFTDENKNVRATDYNSEHLVVFEDGNKLSEVVAANYAYSIGADICSIPQVSKEEAEALCERFYSSSSPSNFFGQTEELENLKSELKLLSSGIPLNNRKILTFITESIPWGFAYPEIPTTHIYSYPDMGLSLVNAFVAEQPNSDGLSLALMIDPAAVSESEIDSVKKSFKERRISQKILRGPNAKVYDVTRNVAWLPYDLLLISTHCGDVSGYRWTYEYVDSEGIDRTLVTDIAIGVSQIPEDDEMLEVVQFSSFVSLDGVDWKDQKAKKKLYVGKAILDYAKRMNDGDFEPAKKEIVERVYGSSALKMWDHNYIPVPNQVAGQGFPIVINNACSSWHRLASTFMFANSRAYIGTLFEVLDGQACEIVKKITDKYFGKPLAVALWRSQNEVYDDSVKRPYILVGPHFQKLKGSQGGHLESISKKLNTASINALRGLNRENSDSQKKRIHEEVQFLQGEIKALNQFKRSQN